MATVMENSVDEYLYRSMIADHNALMASCHRTVKISLFNYSFGIGLSVFFWIEFFVLHSILALVMGFPIFISACYELIGTLRWKRELAQGIDVKDAWTGDVFLSPPEEWDIKAYSIWVRECKKLTHCNSRRRRN